MTKWKWLLLLSVLISPPLYADREITIGYQGVVESKGVEKVPATATGLFKFVLCDKDCTTTYWSNDGSSAAGSAPNASVSLTITKGVFNVLLGDAAALMAPIPLTLFEDLGDNSLYLRVWYDDGTSGFEQFEPDQKLPIVPYAARAEMIGSLSDINSIATKGDLNMTGGLSIESDKLTASTTAFQVDDATRTLFSISGDGTVTTRSYALAALTAASEISRQESGRLFYDGNQNKFMGCNNTSCAEIGLAGPTGVADITSVTAGSGLTGGGTTGDLTFAIDTGVVVTKTGDHTMTGSLTATGLVASTLAATTMATTTLAVTEAISANSVAVTGMATDLGLILLPTGIAAGNTAEVRFQELAANGSNYVGFKSPDSILTSKLWTLPSVEGLPGEFFATNGLGTFSWIPATVGTVRAVTAGLGLTGGASSGDATVTVGDGDGVIVGADDVSLDMISNAAGTGSTSNNSGLEISAAGQLGLLQGCSDGQVLKWNDSASTWDCSALTPPTESVTDSTAYATLPNGELNIAEVMDSAEPSIAPDATGNRVWVRGSILLSAAGIDEEISTFRIYRDTADDTNCDGSQVGVSLDATTSAVGTFAVPFSFIDSPGSTAAQYYSVCGFTDTATSPNGVAVIMLTVQEVPAAGADLAELYPTTDTTIQAGTVVSLDAGLAFGVQKSSRAGDKTVLGVISTDPGLLLDDGVGTGTVVPVALYGRVPVQVTTHEGADPIAVGDYLTVSEIPGVAMKASKSGMVIGKALSRLESGAGSVFMFIEQGQLKLPEEPLAGAVETNAAGFATVEFKTPLHSLKPPVQLTVERDSLTFAHVQEYLTDAAGNTTGFVIRTFAPSGAAVPKVIVHHRVMGTEGGRG